MKDTLGKGSIEIFANETTDRHWKIIRELYALSIFITLALHLLIVSQKIFFSQQITWPLNLLTFFAERWNT